MTIKKCVITKGNYMDKELRLLVSYDECDKPLDLINLDVTKVGVVCEATVEKVLKDIDASILKLSIGAKGFIENRKLKPELFTIRHSQNKPVCQGDKFYVQITQDKKGHKPLSCNFINAVNDAVFNYDFIDYYIQKYCDDCEIVSDLPEILEKDIHVREYKDSDTTLWQIYDLTKLLDNTLSPVVHLKNGGNIVIEPTEALTVIDVNTAKNGGKGSFYETNKQAIEATLSQMRLRSISGIIIIDMLKVSNEEEVELVSYFKSLAKNDLSAVSIHGFTHLGLMEVTRSRMFAPFTI